MRDWEIDQAFPEVPASLLRSELWRLASVQKWKRSGNILIKEARALVKGFVRVVTSARVRDVRQQLLCDNSLEEFRPEMR